MYDPSPPVQQEWEVDRGSTERPGSAGSACFKGVGSEGKARTLPSSRWLKRFSRTRDDASGSIGTVSTPSQSQRQSAERSFTAPGRSQVLLLANSIATLGARGLTQAAEANAQLGSTSATQVLRVP